ncbi:MAG: prolipoprotein diacylglyceryl transferase [Chthoniobacteraceae bacterium]
MLAAYLHDLSPFVFKIGEWGPRWYGIAYIVSFALAYWLYTWLARRRYTDMPEAKVGDFITLAAIFGVMIGGRVGWIFFYGLRQHHDSPWWMLKVWEGGMSSHGGIIGLILFTAWFARKHRLSWTGIGDSLCVVACVGLFVVRCANFINGELWGKPAGEPGSAPSVAWAVAFPQELEDRMPSLDAIRHDAATRAALLDTLPPRHPSQLYEALLEGVCLFTVLWLLRTRARLPRGVITGIFFILYAALRIVGETFREPDPAWSWLGLSAGQTLSLWMVIVGAGFIAWGLRARQYEPVFARDAR